MISVAAGLAQLAAPVESALPWRDAYFGTLTERLGASLRIVPRTSVRLIAVDDESLRRSGEAWPWGSATVQALTERIEAAHPRLVAVDLGTGAPRASAPAGAATLDPKLAGNPAAIQSALRAPATAGSLPLFNVAGNTVRPSFELATALAFFGAERARIDAVAETPSPLGRAAGIQSVHVGTETLATNADGSVRLLPAAAPTGLMTIPAWRVSAGDETALRDLNGSLVVVRRASDAATDAGWQRAQGLAQIVNAMTPARPPWAGLAEAALAALAGAFIALSMVTGRAGQAVTLAFGAAFAAILASIAFFFLKLELLDPIAAVVFMLPGFFAGALGAAFIRALSNKPAAPQATMRVARARVRGTERREVSVLVCKIRELEAVTEAYRDQPTSSPRSSASSSATAADIARAHRGTVENLNSHGLVAVFNAPRRGPPPCRARDRSRACDARAPRAVERRLREALRGRHLHAAQFLPRRRERRSARRRFRPQGEGRNVRPRPGRR